MCNERDNCHEVNEESTMLQKSVLMRSRVVLYEDHE
jgi:hypothetical protein